MTGSGDVPPGQGSSSLVSVNGAVTGEHRGLPVTAENQCVAFASNLDVTCSLDVVSGFSAQDGDSGGPVYQYSSNGAPEVSAAGTVVGSSDVEIGGVGAQTCVQQITAEENYFNVDVATATP